MVKIASNGVAPNNSFKPNLLRYSKSVTEKACHAFASTTQVGLIQVLGAMATLRILAVSILPGLLVGAWIVGYAALETRISQCDPKLGCSGGVEFAALLGILISILSALGCAVAAISHRAALANFTRKCIVLSILLVATVLGALQLTVPHWPVSSFAATFALWVLLSSIVAWVIIAGFRWLAPNNSFKPNLLRKSA